MSSTWKRNLSLSLFGESHGTAIGVVIDNLPAGEAIDMDALRSFLARRAPRKDLLSTQRREKDIPQILSGLMEGKTTGTPLTAIIQNVDAHSQDYNNIAHVARPGHADFTGHIRYHGFNDIRGGGHFSGRLTAPLVFAGAICGQILERRNIFTGAHIFSVYNTFDTPFHPTDISNELLESIKQKNFPVIDDEQGRKMMIEIEKARQEQDSVGGIIECIATGIPAGLGSPMFDGLENTIAQLIFGIPAVKGLEFGDGFTSTQLRGSENNDSFIIRDDNIITATNHHGGILGGISSGMPLLLRVAMKPTASISREQKTVDYKNMTETNIVIQGRHDPCIVTRAVPVVEAAVNIAVLSHLMESKQFRV